MCPSPASSQPDQQPWWASGGGYAILPQPYRAAWADEPLPDAVAQAARLPGGTPLGALDGRLARACDDAARLEPVVGHVVQLFTQRVHRRPRSPLARRRIAPGPWPEGLDPWQVPFSLRTRSLLERHGRLGDTGWLARASAADLGGIRLCGPLTVLEVAAILERHLAPRAATADAGTERLETALEAVVRGTVAEGNVERMLRRLGWDGEGVRTLQQVADDAGVTRERIRQIETSLKARLRAETRLPVLDRAIAALDDAVRTEAEADGVEVLRAAGVTALAFKPRGVLTAAEVFHREVGFEVDQDDERTIRRRLSPEQTIPMNHALHELGRELGAVMSLAEFLEGTAARGGVVDAGTARLFLSRRQRLEWLDERREWFWQRQTQGHPGVEHGIHKVLAVSGRIPSAELGRALAHKSRLWPRQLPVEAIEGLCRTAGLCVEDGMVWSPAPIDPAAVLSPNELAVYTGLRESGGVMPVHELRGGTEIASSTLSTLLGQSPIVERGPGDLVVLVSSRRPRSRAQAAPAAQAPILS
jgi:hypothetical protein